ncbi:hypothetical protein KA082_00945 [Candidatus Woesebacteria bacterium]|nr:hypothetical protein [Candidatus Woesebacteria bacterium]
MKQKINPFPILIISILFLLIVSICGFVFYIYRTDTVTYWAYEMYPLGTKQKYVIQLNEEVKNNDGTVALPAGMFYTFLLPGETQQQPYLSGRQISSTIIDLNPYVGKEVYIKGFFSEGTPLFLKNENIPEYFVTGKRATLNIQSVKLPE